MVIFEFPSCLGLKRIHEDVNPGVERLPSWLNKFGLQERMNAHQVRELLPPEYSGPIDPESGVRNADEIS